MANRMPSFRMDRGNIKASVSCARFRGQYDDAQRKLDARVMADMVPYMPKRTGRFVQTTKAQSATMAGTGRVMAAAPPYGYFLYWGKVMVDPETGSAWARRGVKKVLTDESLSFNGSAKAQPGWYLAAKRQHLGSWLKLAKRTAGGGAK